jgi:hypothetical protein
MKQENKMSPTSRYLHVDVDGKTRPTHDAEIAGISALVAEQQRQIEEGEKRIAEMQRGISAHADKLDAAAKDYAAYCADLGCASLMEVAEKFESLQSSARQMKEALEFYESDEHWRVNGKLDPNGPNFIGQLHARAALQSAASLGLGPDWCKEAEPSFKFELGAPVRKVSGYQFDGYVRMRGRLPQGERYVVESEASPGLLHIFSDAQLETRAKGGGDADH